MAKGVLRVPEVLCWGGPEHGHVWALPGKLNDSYKLAVARLRQPIEPGEGDIRAFIQTIEYRLEYIVDGVRRWPVLVYSDKHEALKRNLSAHIKVIYWMANPS
jgi:hypothetical protein